MRLSRLGEFNFIDRVSRGLKLSSSVVKGIGDDAAVLKYSKDRYLLFTTDMLIEGKHFLKTHSPRLIGKKSVFCSISDIASMGGRPTSFVISIGVPGGLDIKYADELYKGVKDAAKRFKIDLVGGDTVCSDKIVISIAMLGEARKRDIVLRSGAGEGDTIFVTGNIGGSIKGRHLRFSPRVKEAEFLVRNYKINSMIDVSDGLLADLGHILEESGKGAVIYESMVPISRNAKDFDFAIRDGEDFELVFSISSDYAERLKKIWPFRTRLSMIGRICSSRKGFSLIRKNGKSERIKPKGFAHF